MFKLWCGARLFECPSYGLGPNTMNFQVMFLGPSSMNVQVMASGPNTMNVQVMFSWPSSMNVQVMVWGLVV